MESRLFLEQSQAFLNYLAEWQAKLPAFDLVAEIGEPQHAAIISVDLTKGFCTTGPLASPRVQAIVAPVVRLFERAQALGVSHFILPQDTHEPDAVEFSSFPPHCVRGTDEAVTVPELTALPFASQFRIMPKNSIDSSVAAGFQTWLDEHPDVQTFIVVGDCTDFCVYQIGMALRTRANHLQHRSTRIIVPADCVDTYDVPVDVARSLGILPHPGDLIHLFFLYHMAVNGIEIASSVK